MVVRVVAAFLLLLAGGLTSHAGELKSETLAAWNDYVHAANAHMKERLSGQLPFLWVDETPARRQRVRSGEILIARAEGDGPHKVPHGLIHDWVGAAFIPNATISGVFGVVRDYDRYQEFYGPTVARVNVLSANPNEDRFRMVWIHKVFFVTAAIDSEYESKYVQVDKNRWYNSASSTHVQEIKNFGQTDQETLPCDRGDGFLWRLHSIVRYAERDGGVYIEVEAIGLTRDIPFSMQWVLKPIAEHLSKDSIQASLEGTRDAVQQEALSAQTRNVR